MELLSKQQVKEIIQKCKNGNEDLISIMPSRVSLYITTGALATLFIFLLVISLNEPPTVVGIAALALFLLVCILGIFGCINKIKNMPRTYLTASFSMFLNANKKEYFKYLHSEIQVIAYIRINNSPMIKLWLNNSEPIKIHGNIHKISAADKISSIRDCFYFLKNNISNKNLIVREANIESEFEEMANEIIDPILGEMHFEEEGWTASVTKDNDSFKIHIYCHSLPEPAIFENVYKIISSYKEFKKAIFDYITKKSQEYPEDIKQELSQLKIESIQFRITGKVIIFFEGKDNNIGLWHCDYIDNEPAGLGCDT